MRAILETLRVEQQPVVLYRVRAADDLVHLPEIDALAKARQGRVCTLVGPRVQLAVKDPFSATELRSAVPDVETREVFVCGPESKLHAARKGLTSAGVPLERIHCERFWY